MLYFLKGINYLKKVFELSENYCYTIKKNKGLIRMEKYLLNAPKQSVGNVVDSLFAEMVLEKALYDFRKAELKRQIDETLIAGDRELFYRLTEELNQLTT